MKITICWSSTFWKEMLKYRDKLWELWHEWIVHPDYEHLVAWTKPDLAKLIKNEHSEAKKLNWYIKWYHNQIMVSDWILVLNFDKKWISNYIWWNTLLEIWFAHVNDKKVFLLNNIPDLSYKDEILAMYDKILKWDLSSID